MASNTTGNTVTLPVLGDPEGMRPADTRYLAGYIGEYELADGHVVWAQWLTSKKTHCHIVVWDEKGIVGTVEDKCRLQAARTTEALFVALES